jgi:hypothetical protein
VHIISLLTALTFRCSFRKMRIVLLIKERWSPGVEPNWLKSPSGRAYKKQYPNAISSSDRGVSIISIDRLLFKFDKMNFVLLKHWTCPLSKFNTCLRAQEFLIKNVRFCREILTFVTLSFVIWKPAFQQLEDFLEMIKTVAVLIRLFPSIIVKVCYHPFYWRSHDYWAISVIITAIFILLVSFFKHLVQLLHPTCHMMTLAHLDCLWRQNYHQELKILENWHSLGLWTRYKHYCYLQCVADSIAAEKSQDKWAQHVLCWLQRPAPRIG